MKKSNIKKISPVISSLEDQKSLLEDILAEEQERYDNLSDRAQENDKGQYLFDCISALETAIGDFEQAIDNLTEASSEYEA